MTAAVRSERPARQKRSAMVEDSVDAHCRVESEPCTECRRPRTVKEDDIGCLAELSWQDTLLRRRKGRSEPGGMDLRSAACAVLRSPSSPGMQGPGSDAANRRRRACRHARAGRLREACAAPAGAARRLRAARAGCCATGVGAGAGAGAGAASTKARSMSTGCASVTVMTLSY